jgi:uncharacterized repeat protein (TIGR01451 family)
VDKELISPVTPGTDLVYRISLTNIGGQPAAGVVLTDTLPAGTTYVSDSRGDGTLVGKNRLVWDVSTLDSGARETIELTLHLPDTAPPDAYLKNSVRVSTIAGEPYTDDNRATVTLGNPDETWLPIIMNDSAPASD